MNYKALLAERTSGECYGQCGSPAATGGMMAHYGLQAVNLATAEAVVAAKPQPAPAIR